MRSLERWQKVSIRTTYVRTHIHTTGQTLYRLHNFDVRGDNKRNKIIPLLSAIMFNARFDFHAFYQVLDEGRLIAFDSPYL